MPTITIEQAFHLAVTYYQAGQLATAQATCRQILSAEPRRPDVTHLLGLIAAAGSRYEEALQWFSQAVVLAPERASYHCDCGTTLCFLRRREEAVPYFRRALELNPQSAETWNNLGDTLLRLGQVDEAIACGQRALALRPDYADAHNNLGNALRDKGRYNEAVGQFQKALALNPNDPIAHNNLGYAYIQMDRLDEASASCERALALNPNFAEALLNLGAVHVGKRQPEQANLCFRRAIACQPGYHDAHWNYGLTSLLLGDYEEESWKEFDWRRRTPFGGTLPDIRVPQWDGTPAGEGAILVYPEQGIGDAIQFLRYLPLVKRNVPAIDVLFLCPTPLIRLLEQSGGWNATLIACDRWNESTLPQFDRHVSLLSLPLALRLFEPQHAGEYLQADPELRAIWRQRIGSAKAFRVGLAWAGNPKHPEDRHRSIDPRLFAALPQLPGVSMHSLQVKPPHGIPPELASAGLIDLTEHINDFADTAALIAELDLVITVDTAVAHLAGALGRPVWTLLPRVPDWRWGLEREDTPWYPAMRLFRQTTPGDWASVIQRVTVELKSAASTPIRAQ